MWRMNTLLILLVWVQIACSSPHRSNPKVSHRVEDKLGASATENKVCTNIAIDILKKGGNAADALVGSTLCVGVIGMEHSGIGGGYA